MNAEWTTATFTALSAVATVALVIAAIVQLNGLKAQLKASADQQKLSLDQLKLSAEQLHQTSEQERRRITLEAVQRSESDPFIKAAYKEIQAKTAGTSDYAGTAACKDDITTILNYFEGLAIGIAQDIYIEQMARDYLQEELKLAVDIWIVGDPRAVKAPPQMFGQNEFTQLRGLYKKWFPEPALGYKAH
jgi:hypothetical protein